LKKIRTEIGIVTGFYQQQPAYRLATDLGADYQTVTRVYQKLRLSIYHIAELEGAKLSGDIEMDESYFGGKRKGKRGRGATGKSIVFGLLERDGRVYTRVVEGVSADDLMAVIRKKTRKGSVYYSDTFKSYNSLKRLGKHLTINHSKNMVDKRTKNHINGIEGFWSFAKHILYNYRGVS
jgi:transposase